MMRYIASAGRNASASIQWLQEQDHQRLEYADPAGHMADECDQLCGEERAQEIGEVRPRLRQQHVQHRRRQPPVER